ncbi:hypothetical protein PYCC9005_000775 [Savitreella phatthalungensis]
MFKPRPLGLLLSGCRPASFCYRQASKRFVTTVQHGPSGPFAALVRPLLFASGVSVASFGTVLVLDSPPSWLQRSSLPTYGEIRGEEQRNDRAEDRDWDIMKTTVLAGIIGINVIGYGLHAVNSVSRSAILSRLLSHYGTSSLVESYRRPASLLTSGFSHSEIWHLGLNMLALYSIGNILLDEIRLRYCALPTEDRLLHKNASWLEQVKRQLQRATNPDEANLGHANFRLTDSESAAAVFLAIYLSGIVISSLGQLAFQARGALRATSQTAFTTAINVRSLGASGGVYAVIIALAVLQASALPVASFSQGRLDSNDRSAESWHRAVERHQESLAEDRGQSRTVLRFLLFPFVSVELSTAALLMVAFDILGLLAGWKVFGHAAHLSGAMTGFLAAGGLSHLIRLDIAAAHELEEHSGSVNARGDKYSSGREAQARLGTIEQVLRGGLVDWVIREKRRNQD